MRLRVRLGGAEISIEQARRLASAKNGKAADGIDPSADKRTVRQSETLQQLFDRWCEDHADVRLAERTRVTDKSRFDTCLKSLASRRVLAITEADVRALHAKVGREHGKVSANRAVQLLRRLLNWGKVAPNPAAKAVDLFTERSRERFVLPAEMGPLFKALDDEKTNPLIRDFVYLCLWCGQRRSTVQSMAISEIDLERGVWTIPAEKTKGKRPIHVPLVAPALEIIKRRMGHPSGYILASYGERGHLVEPKAGWKGVLKRAKLNDITIHDLRRSFGSYQAAMGTNLPTIGASLGHANLAATQIYSRLHLDPVRQSVTAAVQAMQAAAVAKPQKEAGTATTPTPAT